jgi:glycosyltransferase involved in cell wall biosynthesis
LTGTIRKIRILLTVPHLSNTASPYREMMALAKYLPRDQFQLTICSLLEDGYAKTAPILENLGCRVMVARFRHLEKKFPHLCASWKDQKLLTQCGPFDLQHSLDSSASPWEALFAKIHSRVFIFSQRNLAEGQFKAGIWLKIRLAKKIVAISHATVQVLQSLGADLSKVEKIPLGIEPYICDLQGYSNITDGRYILSASHIHPRKRQKDAIKALGRLVDEIPDLSLVIVGHNYDPDYYQELRRLTGVLGLERRVHFLGERDDVRSLMKTASALTLCSDSEGFGWVILEAMSVGLPVVASDSGGLTCPQ